MTRVAVLDDWQGIARTSADWSALEARAEVVFFAQPFRSEEEAARKLADFEILLSMRERTPFPASLIERLPRLRMIGITGLQNRTLDLAACTARKIVVSNTVGHGRHRDATAELALGLMLAAARSIPAADANMRSGRFQEGLPAGMSMCGKTVGIIGLGKLGTQMARYCRALGMNLLAWSPNLTAERAEAEGGTLVSKQELLSRSDVVSIHVVLSARSRGMIGAVDLALMKPGAILVNTSRGPLVDEAALVAALESGRILAGLDVYDEEPLPAEHPLRRAPNTVLTPHLGYGVQETWEEYYPQSVENALAFLDGRPVRVVNPEVL
jgi:phosphoglycerate dehydrogenase-like enzyme